MILLIDNYDSFVFNLARYFECLGQSTQVVRNDAITPERIRSLRPAAIVLSPGPCTPDEAGCSLAIVEQLAGEFPILGICLGHQAIGQALGARIVRAQEPMHGRVSAIEHDRQGVFATLPTPFQACRYHSLAIDGTSLPDELQIQARTADGTIMAVRHREHPLVGVQFHPESILTEHGHALLANFLSLAGVSLAVAVPELSHELHPPRTSSVLPAVPVTF